MNLKKRWVIGIAHHLPSTYKSLPKPYLEVFNKLNANDESPFCDFTDGINGLTAKNSTWGEISTLFKLSENFENTEMLGLFHYRRQLDLNNISKKLNAAEISGKKLRIFSILQLIRINRFRGKVVLPEPLHFSNENMTIIEQFRFCHEPLIDAMEKASKIFDNLVKAKYNFSSTQFMATNDRLMPCNIFLAPKEFISEWLEILYPILFELDKESAELPSDGYQSRWGGFIAERLFSCFCEMKMQNSDLEFIFKPLIRFT